MNLDTATREIMWNVGGLPNTIAMYLFFALAVLIGFSGIWRHVELYQSAKPADAHLDKYFQRFCDLFRLGFLQHGVIREKSVAIAHSLIYIGFLALVFTTTMVLIDHDFGIKIYQGRFYLAVTILSDILGLGVLIGCLMIGKRRYIDQPDCLHTKLADSLALIVLSLLVIQGFALEGLRIHVTEDPWAMYSPVGLLFAKSFWFLSNNSAEVLHYVTWWFHTFTVFAVIAVIPYSKAFHILISSLNLYFKNDGRPKGALRSPGDIEQLIEKGDDFSLGTETIKDYNWKQVMDLDACTSCGRCQNACPAYNSNKPLSPKWVILDTRNHAVANNFSKSILPKFLLKLDELLSKHFFLKSSGVEANDKTADTPIAGGVIDPDVFWSCTTCYACVAACPVGINQVDQIIENRRNMVLMQGEVPSEAQGALRAVESQANPYGAAEDRSNWFQDLDLPIVKPGEQVDYLYWVGCVSAYDKRKQKIARSLVKIMKSANLSFGVLGNAEGCTGDPARRIGEENLFQSMAKQNIELLQSVKFKYLVANCPHCFNTIKNEYPDFGKISPDSEAEIIHHSVLLKKLLAEGKIATKQSSDEYTFHDPCYLGRYNDEYDAPREALQKTTRLKIIEMDESRDKGMCCGAGGGHYWMDLKQGERINSIRATHAAETGASKIATACPFCMQMMEDGVKLNGQENSLEVKDIAEVVAENLVTS